MASTRYAALRYNGRVYSVHTLDHVDVARAMRRAGINPDSGERGFIVDGVFHRA